MSRIGIIAVGSLLALGTAAYGQEPSAVLSTTVPATSGPYYLPFGVEQTGPQTSTTLFSIGGVGVHVWTPVVPSHSTDADRVFATGPIWGAS